MKIKITPYDRRTIVTMQPCVKARLIDIIAILDNMGISTTVATIEIKPLLVYRVNCRLLTKQRTILEDKLYKISGIRHKIKKPVPVWQPEKEKPEPINSGIITGYSGNLAFGDYEYKYL
jgi:hypothetical protein